MATLITPDMLTSDIPTGSIINLKDVAGTLRIPVNGRIQRVDVGSDLMVTFNDVSTNKTYRFIGRVCSISREIIYFDVLSAESSHTMFLFNIDMYYRDIISIVKFTVRKVPLIINWCWIGSELRRRYFGNVL